jgi:pimeloyl-ACP methyl ester carboxylesterase
VSLCCYDFGGAGPAVLLLHGLAGQASEWRATASWLRRIARVYALDQRGHGRSDRAPGAYSREAYVGDAAAAIEQLGLARAVVLGQSMGGLNAFLVAARHAALVRALIVVEAEASADEAGVRSVQAWLRSLPVPFSSASDAQAWLADAGFPGDSWQELVEEREGGWWPRFDVEGAIASIEDAATTDYWREWRSIACPTLVVGGAGSSMPKEELRRMAEAIPAGSYAEVAGAGHNVHLDEPEGWRSVVEPWLAALDLR